MRGMKSHSTRLPMEDLGEIGTLSATCCADLAKRKAFRSGKYGEKKPLFLGLFLRYLQDDLMVLFSGKRTKVIADQLQDTTKYQILIQTFASMTTFPRPPLAPNPH